MEFFTDSNEWALGSMRTIDPSYSSTVEYLSRAEWYRTAEVRHAVLCAIVGRGCLVCIVPSWSDFFFLKLPRFQSEQANAVACLTLLDHGFMVYEGAERKEQDLMLDILSALHNTKGAYFGRVNMPKEASYHMGQYLEDQKQIRANFGGKPSAKLAAAYSELALAQLECGESKDVISLLKQSSAIRKQLKTFTAIDLYNPLRYEGLYHIHVGNWAEAERCLFTALLDRQAKYGLDDHRGPRFVAFCVDCFPLTGTFQGRSSSLEHRRPLLPAAKMARRTRISRSSLPEPQRRRRRGSLVHLTRTIQSCTWYVRNQQARISSSGEVRFSLSVCGGRPRIDKHCRDSLELCSNHYGQHEFVEGEKARVVFLLGRVLEMMGDHTASNKLEQAARMRDALIQKEDKSAVETLTFAAFDKIVSLGAR